MSLKQAMSDALRSEDVAYQYLQNEHGLAPTSLTARPGEFILVRGPSGCGKSTLARCLTGLILHLYRGRLGGASFFAYLLRRTQGGKR